MDGDKDRDNDEGPMVLMNFKAMLNKVELQTAMLKRWLDGSNSENEGDYDGRG